MNAIKKDNKLMALLSIWGILLVCLGHSGFEEPIIAQNLSGLHSWIYSFHMPLFFFISGYLFSLTNKNFLEIDARKFMKKKILRLVVPYVVLGTIIFFIKFAFSGYSHAVREFTVGNFFKMFLAPGCVGSTMGYLWYVITLFVVFVLVIALSKIHVDLKRDLWCLLIIVAAWSFYVLGPKVEWLNFSSVCRYLPYFVLGIIYYRHESAIQTFVNRGGYCSLLIFSAISIVLTVVSIPLQSWITEPVRAVIGIMMSIQLCTMLLKSNWVKEHILPLSKYTYSIYLLSWFSQYAVKVSLMDILHVHWAIAVPAMFAAQVVVSILVCVVVDKVEWLGNKKWLRLIIGY